MGEIIGTDFLSIGHAGISFSKGKLVLSADVDVSDIVDFVVNAAEKSIPGDFEVPLLEIVRAAAKATLKNQE